MMGEVVAVSRKPTNGIAKPNVVSIRLIVGHGVEGDVHFGTTVQHRSRIAQNPDQPNLRQVHLIQAELFDELVGQGFQVAPGDMGENITTRGVNLLALPEGTELALGDTARIRITGLRNPCKQLEGHAPGLMKAVLDKDADGNVIRKAGVMAVVLEGGAVRAGDKIALHLPEGEQKNLEPV